jgi:hypothetical protein
MDAVIVPCTHEKIWAVDPSRGATPAKDVYTKEAFAEWRRYAEASGCEWFILSTRHGLLRPDDVVEADYNVSISMAIRDAELLDRLRAQGAQIDFSRFDKVILVDWERFEPLVKVAVGDSAPCVLRKVVY